ncbi:MAG: histidine phosphatase family protein [Candidatus Taylorbacteria bacterium]|nr:histidine phosphatase family protein [Candidatus Taylorbacteria bacterium]
MTETTKTPKTSRKKLKAAIAIRHGEYSDQTSELNPEGIEQVKFLAGRLKKLVKPRHIVKIFSSPVVRARQSAEILAEHLKTQVQEIGALGYDEFESGQHQMNELLGQKDGVDVIVAVTHFVAPSGIIDAFSRKFFSKTAFEKAYESRKGDGHMICLKTGTVTKSLLA